MCVLKRSQCGQCGSLLQSHHAALGKLRSKYSRGVEQKDEELSWAEQHKKT